MSSSAAVVAIDAITRYHTMNVGNHHATSFDPSIKRAKQVLMTAFYASRIWLKAAARETHGFSSLIMLFLAFDPYTLALLA
jgi:hypothetical protein